MRENDARRRNYWSSATTARSRSVAGVQDGWKDPVLTSNSAPSPSISPRTGRSTQNDGRRHPRHARLFPLRSKPGPAASNSRRIAQIGMEHAPSPADLRPFL